MSKRHCPICGSDKNQELYKLSIDNVINLIFPDSEQKNVEQLKKIVYTLWNQEEVSYFKCTDCHYGFAYPYVAGNTDYYSQLYYNCFEYPKVKWEYLKTLDTIKCLPDKENIKIIEIGAGNGSFLDLISKVGIQKKNIFCTEFSSYACETLKSKGYKPTDLSLGELLKHAKLPAFEIICMFQVLEHLDNIEEVFHFTNQFSSDNASLFIAVPNAKLRYLLDQYGIHYDIPPTHVGKLPLETFEFLAKKYGWQIMEHSYETATYKEKIKKFLFERYWNNKTAIRYEKLEKNIPKYLLRYLILLSIFIRYHKIFYKLRHNFYGTSFWICFKKISKNNEE